MSRDRLDVAVVLPETSTMSGGVERLLKLLEYSGSAEIAYTVFLTDGGARNEEFVERLQNLERLGCLNLCFLPQDRVSESDVFDYTLVPSEYWIGPLGKARSAGIKAPPLIEFMQLPYLGTMDILRLGGMSPKSRRDLWRVPFLSASVYGDSLPLGAFQTLACAISVRSASRLEGSGVLALTPVTAQNLRALRFTGSLYVPECPVGIEGDLVQNTLRKDEAVSFDAIYVGRFHPQKGFLDLPVTVAHLKKRLGREVNVAVCGGSQFSRHLRKFQRRARGLGVERNLTILGRVSKSELYSTMCRARMLLYPSYVDSFSITILESLCLGLPVVAYDIDALRLIWAERKGVFLAPVGNPEALAEVCAEVCVDSRFGTMKGALTRQSRELSGAYTWEKAIQDERRFYESLEDSSLKTDL